MDEIITHKRCSKCGETKQVSEFWRNIRIKDGYEGQCKACHKEYCHRPDVAERNRKYNRDRSKRLYTKEKGRNRNLKKNHNITLDEFHEKLKAQSGKCEICQKPFRSYSGRGIHVDHNHATGKIRGILCYNCNLMIGFAADSKSTLENAVSYIDRYANENPIL